MTLFDGIMILAVLGCLIALLILVYYLFRSQWRRARRILLGLVSFLVIYAAILVSVSVLSPQRKLAMHQDRCFDDWCLSVEQVERQRTVGVAPTVVTAHGIFYLVTLRISSRARAISQRALDVQVYLLDEYGQRYNPDLTGQQVLDEMGQGGKALNSELTPDGSFTHTAIFDMPKSSSHLAFVVSHGLFPDVLVIGSDQSFLHPPTIIQITSG